MYQVISDWQFDKFIIKLPSVVHVLDSLIGLNLDYNQ